LLTGETAIVCVVAPVDQLYEAKPAPASRVALPPAQTEAGPVIVTIGFGLTVTATGDAVPLQPLPFVTVTLKLPVVVAEYVWPVAPPIGTPFWSH
jgi:hypothetical protein